MTKLKPAVFILGTGRSGTTLLRVMLAGHPRLWAPPETKLSLHDTMAARNAHVDQRYWEKGGLRRALIDLQGLSVDEAKAAVGAMGDQTVPQVYAQLQEALGERVLVEKDPALSAHPERLARLEEWFDGNRYLWITRHPGAVVRSFQNMPMAEVMTQGMDVDWRTAWHQSNANIQAFLQGIDPGRWLHLRYEDLVTEPRAVMERVCAALGVPFDEAVLHPYEGDRMRQGPKGARATGDPNMAGRKRIQPDMATKWLDGFDPASVSAETRDLARQLGYDLDAMPRPPITRVSEGIERLFETARALEQRIDLPMDVDNVEGRRFLLRMLSASIDTFVEHADADRPHFHHAEGPTRKMFADCPDTDYLRAPLRLGPGRVYRLSGRIPPGVLYCGVLLYGRGGRVARSLTDAQLHRDADGRFEVRIATEPQDGVWLRADGDENAVMVRQYFGDRATEPRVELHLECLDPQPPTALDATWMAEQLVRSERMLKAVFERTLQGYTMARVAALNQFIEVPAEALFPTPDNTYRVCWYRIGPDQCMIVRGTLPDARYFGLSLCNAWMESLDYLAHPRSNRNHTQLHADPGNGAFEAVLAHADPGHPGWIDVAGHDAGFLLARYLLPHGALPPLSVQICYLHELPDRRTM